MSSVTGKISRNASENQDVVIFTGHVTWAINNMVGMFKNKLSIFDSLTETTREGETMK